MTHQENISKKDIVDYLEMIISSIGLKSAVSGKSLEVMKNAFPDRKNSHDCIFEIQKFFCLKEIKLFVRYIRKKNDFFDNNILNNLPYETSFFKNEINDIIDYYFNDKKELAHIQIPENMPMFGTEAFRNLRLNLSIRHFVREESFETFSYTIAHEMCHAVLYSTRHSLKESEIATDLCAMTQGFYEIMKVGRYTSTGKCGYLDDEQFKIAYHWILSQKSSGIKKLWNKFLLRHYLKET